MFYRDVLIEFTCHIKDVIFDGTSFKMINDTTQRYGGCYSSKRKVCFYRVT